MTKIEVEFLGDPLAALPFGVKPEAVLDATHGRFTRVEVEAVPDGVAGHWRVFFDFTLEGQAPADLRLFLRSAERTLSETWLFPFRPA